MGPRKYVLDGVQVPARKGEILRGGSGRPITCSDVSGGRYSQSDSAGGSTGTVRMLIGCTRWGAHWRNLANTIEPFMCDSDEVFLSNNFDHWSKHMVKVLSFNSE